MLKQSSKVIVVGCGGIGSWLIPPLCRFLKSDGWAGQVHLIDGDVYEDGNQSRQDISADANGQNKAQAQLLRISPMYPTMNISAHTEYVSNDNVDALVVANSVVFVCVDNHPARARIDRRASKLDDICVISAGNEETDGNVTISLRRGGQKITESLIHRHPEVGRARKHDRAAGCEDLIEEGNKQLLITNLAAATAALMAFQMLWDPPAPKGDKAPTFPQDIYFDINQGAFAMVPAMAGEGG